MQRASRQEYIGSNYDDYGGITSVGIIGDECAAVPAGANS